jgi:hypothetical protein
MFRFLIADILIRMAGKGQSRVRPIQDRGFLGRLPIGHSPTSNAGGFISVGPPYACLAELGDFLEKPRGNARRGIVGIDKNCKSG